MMERTKTDSIMEDYEIIRSRRKTVGLEVTRDGRVLVRAPYRLPKSAIDQVVSRHERWIKKHQEMIRQEETAAETQGEKPLTYEDIQALADQALRVIPERVAFYAPKVGVTYGRITIRNQKTRWGSCSAKGNLNFNCLLMLMPPEVVDSVVVHELCHRLYMNHSKQFYEEVLRVYPAYWKWNDWLNKNGGRIMRRMKSERASERCR